MPIIYAFCIYTAADRLCTVRSANRSTMQGNVIQISVTVCVCAQWALLAKLELNQKTVNTKSTAKVA